MASISEALALAIQHHQNGRLQVAEQAYRQILQMEPNQPDALHLLGVMASQLGKHEAAVEYIGRAIAVNQNMSTFHNNLGEAFRALHRSAEAADCYRRALQLKPDFAEAHNNLGAALKEQGKLDETVACYRRALQLKPDHAAAHNNLGNALKDQGKPNEAIACYRRALALKPGVAVVHYNLGNVLEEKGQFDEASACYRRALELQPDHAAAHNNLGNALKKQGNLAGAIDCYRQALKRTPDDPEVHNNLGNTLQEQGKLDEAADCLRRAVQLKPNYAEAHNNLGNALKEQGNVDEAVACYRRTLEFTPDNAEANYNLGNALKELGKLDEAVACYRRALELKPSHAAALGSLVHWLQHQCCWEGLEVLSRRLIEIVDTENGGTASPVSPFVFLALPELTTAEQQLRCARQWVERKLKAGGQPGRKRTWTRPACASKITVGYLSADFHAHATAWLIAEMIEQHDRDRFAVLGYSYGPDDGSPTRRRMVNAFDRFVDVKNASFEEAARRILADEVDILVDLKGFTKNARTEILALRPAPIQVSYLGYPGTMGADFIDYVLVDDFVVPAEQQPYFAEKLVHLPGSYQVNDSRREVSLHTPTRAECGLPKDGFVFCAFNNSYKITAPMFGVWMDLLKAIPGSVLWLLEWNRFVADNLRREAVNWGVAAERLVFAPLKPMPEHLARHGLADLFLDTLPCNAHTTASDALWVGCPVLTLPGQTFASRVAGSLLRAIGLPELITTSLDDYRALTLRLAQDADLLAQLRTRLEANRKTSPLFDGRQFARNIEKAFAAMWETWKGKEDGAGTGTFIVH
jgi:protein O-GlcNAc transferase